LNVECKTWKKEAEDLFDFEANDVITTELELKDINSYSKCYLVYSNEKIIMFNSYNALLEKNKECQIKTKDNNINNKDKDNSFLIISELHKISPSNFKIYNPILSYNLHKKLNNNSCLCRAWRLSKKNEENLIQTGDIIKLGRIRLKIETICLKDQYESSQITYNFFKNKMKLKSGYSLNVNKNINNNVNTNINNSQNDSFLEEEKMDKNNNLRKKLKEKMKATSIIENSSITSPKNSTSRPTCRICYLLNSDIENPLISPCNCNGSMKYIHYKCLKNCIEANLTKKVEDTFKCLYWKNYSCEICQKEYPKYFKIKDCLYPLIDLDVNFSSYIIADLALYEDTKKKTSRKGIIVIKLNDNNDEDVITLGRSQANRVKLKDISVSRTHCEIIKRKNKFYIVDRGSKFGTLLYVNNPLNLNLSNPEKVIISGRHRFSIKLEEKKSFFAKLFPVNCCQNGEVKVNTNIDVEHLDDNLVDNKNEKEKFFIKDRNNFDNTILDNSYQDYILDLGDNIYLHEQSESDVIYS
jgi:hypothetical protein